MCPAYWITAWNSGGEGIASLPQQGYIRSKLTVPFMRAHCELATNIFLTMCFHIIGPNSIEAEDIDIHRRLGSLYIQLHVSCDLRCQFEQSNMYCRTFRKCRKKSCTYQLHIISHNSSPDSYVNHPFFMDRSLVTIKITLIAHRV